MLVWTHKLCNLLSSPKCRSDLECQTYDSRLFCHAQSGQCCLHLCKCVFFWIFGILFPILLVNQTQISIVKVQPSPPGEFASHCLTDNECKFAHSECRTYNPDEPGQCYCISGFEFNGYDCLPNEHNVAVLEKSQYGSNCTTTIDEGYHLVFFLVLRNRR